MNMFKIEWCELESLDTIVNAFRDTVLGLLGSSMSVSTVVVATLSRSSVVTWTF